MGQREIKGGLRGNRELCVLDTVRGGCTMWLFARKTWTRTECRYDSVFSQHLILSPQGERAVSDMRFEARSVIRGMFMTSINTLRCG